MAKYDSLILQSLLSFESLGSYLQHFIFFVT